MNIFCAVFFAAVFTVAELSAAVYERTTIEVGDVVAPVAYDKKIYIFSPLERNLIIIANDKIEKKISFKEEITSNIKIEACAHALKRDENNIDYLLLNDGILLLVDRTKKTKNAIVKIHGGKHSNSPREITTSEKFCGYEISLVMKDKTLIAQVKYEDNEIGEIAISVRGILKRSDDVPIVISDKLVARLFRAENKVEISGSDNKTSIEIPVAKNSLLPAFIGNKMYVYSMANKKVTIFEYIAKES